MRRTGSYLLLFLLLACSSRDGTYRVETVDGVRHVRNHAASFPEESGIRLERDRTIGGPGVEDDRYMFFFPIDATADPAGNVYVLDSRRPAIRKYDSAGNHVMDMGGEGSGPGEFRSSLCLDTDGAGSLYLSDMDNSRLSVFSPAGEFERVVLLSNFFHFFCVLSDSRIAAQDMAREEEVPKLIKMLDREGALMSAFCDAYPNDDYMMSFMMNRANIESDSRDNIYVSFDHHNRVDKYAPDGTLLMRIERPLNYDVRHEMRMSTAEVEGEHREYPDPSLTLVAGSIGVDGQDRLWVITFAAQPEETGSASAAVSDHTIMQFDVFDAEGILLDRIPIPAPMSRFRIVGEQLIAVDAYTDVCVHVFRIIG